MMLDMKEGTMKKLSVKCRFGNLPSRLQSGWSLDMMMELMLVVMMMEMITIRFVHYCGGKFMHEHVSYHKGAYTLSITQIAEGLPWCMRCRWVPYKASTFSRTTVWLPYKAGPCRPSLVCSAVLVPYKAGRNCASNWRGLNLRRTGTDLYGSLWL